MLIPRRALCLGSLACLLAAGCDEPTKVQPGTTSAAATTTGSIPPPMVATTTASAAAPAATDSAAALPSTDPAPVQSAAPPAATTKPDAGAKADASARPDAGARPAPKASAAADAGAGAGDAGVVAAADAGAPPSPGLVLARQLDAIFAAKPTFSAKFKQQSTPRITGIPKDESGTVLMERPNKISFRYDPPSQTRVVSDGITIKMYTAGDNQMIEMAAQKTQYPGALAFMLGNGISSSFDFAINDKAQWSGGVVLDGKPLTANPSYETVSFYLDTTLLGAKDPGAIKRVLVRDAQGNKNRFDFTNVTQPPSIPASEWTFTPPPGTEIVKR